MNSTVDEEGTAPVDPDEGAAYTTRSDYDTVYAALARRSIRLARATDENPALATVLHKVAMGFVRYCQVKGISEQDYGSVDVEAVLTPSGSIVITMRH